MNYLLPTGASDTVWGKQQTYQKGWEERLAMNPSGNKDFVKLPHIPGTLEAHARAQIRAYAQKRPEKP